MYFHQKLKQKISIMGFIPAMISLSVMFITSIFAGLKVGILAVSLFFILYSGFSLWIYARIRNQSYLAAAIWQFFVGLSFATHPKWTIFHGLDPSLSSIFFFILIASTIWLFYQVSLKKAKWKGREVFELASMFIEHQSDGFTGRPCPVGKSEYTKDELLGFAKFMRNNLIAMPYFEDNSILFVPVKMSDEFSFIFNPDKFRHIRSWVAFDYDGNVTVNISKNDYLDYKEELSFDQLCMNFGRLFIEFMKYFRKGEEDRILYRLNELGLGLTS